MSTLIAQELFQTGPDPYLLQERIVLTTDDTLTNGLAFDPADGFFHTKTLPAGTIGDVVGPPASVANQIPTFADATGKILQTSTVTITAANMTLPTQGIIVTAGNIDIPAPVNGSTTAGLITVAGTRFIHSQSSTTDYNLFMGIGAGNSTTTGTSNACFGSSTAVLNAPGTALTTAARNSIFGCGAGGALTNGNDNVFFGCEVCPVATGSQNTIIGSQAASALTLGSRNVFVGYQTGNSSDGVQNTLIGYRAGFAMTTATDNTLLGYLAGDSLTSGSNNFIVGGNGGTGIQTGNDNIIIGSTGTGLAATASSISIGSNIVDTNTISVGILGTHTACFMQGIDGATTAGAAIAVLIDNNGQLGTISSAAKYKDQVATITAESAARIYDLRPVSFVYKKRQVNEDGSQVRHFGLIADEVAAVIPEIVVFKDGSPETVRYDTLFALLLSEIQRLRKKIEG